MAKVYILMPTFLFLDIAIDLSKDVPNKIWVILQGLNSQILPKYIMYFLDFMYRSTSDENLFLNWATRSSCLTAIYSSKSFSVH